MSGITVQGNNVPITTSSAISAIDTGTTLIGGPSTDVKNIWAAVPGSSPLTGNNLGFYGFPCSTKVEITLSFGGDFWPISSADMNVGTADTAGLCMGAIFDFDVTNAGGGSVNPNWVVGDTFLKNVYSVFRAKPPSIGFAQLSDAAGGSSGTPGAGTAHVSGSSLPTGIGGATSFRATSIRAITPPLLLAMITSALML